MNPYLLHKEDTQWRYDVFLQVIAENLSEEEIMGLKEMFKSMDTDNSGTITFEELKVGLPKLGAKLSESEVNQLMEAVPFTAFPTEILLPSLVFYGLLTNEMAVPLRDFFFFFYIFRLMLMGTGQSTTSNS